MYHVPFIFYHIRYRCCSQVLPHICPVSFWGLILYLHRRFTWGLPQEGQHGRIDSSFVSSRRLHSCMWEYICHIEGMFL
jgi:hypothetical protein